MKKLFVYVIWMTKLLLVTNASATTKIHIENIENVNIVYIVPGGPPSLNPATISKVLPELLSSILSNGNQQPQPQSGTNPSFHGVAPINHPLLPITRSPNKLASKSINFQSNSATNRKPIVSDTALPQTEQSLQSVISNTFGSTRETTTGLLLPTLIAPTVPTAHEDNNANAYRIDKSGFPNVTPNGSNKSNWALLSDKRQLLPPKGLCGAQHLDYRVEKPGITSIDEFPWLVLIQYEKFDENNSVSANSCAGTIINKRYVLTTAECVYDFEANLFRTPDSIFVRAGEYDRFNKTDCVANEYGMECADAPADFTATEVIWHPMYNFSTHSKITGRHPENDIALIRIDADIKYTDYVRAVCLPLSETELAKASDMLKTTGWGYKTEGYKIISTAVKETVRLSVWDDEECRKSGYSDKFACYAFADNQTLDENVCRGQEGAGVFYYHSYEWHIEGILSNCSGTFMRATRVVPYVEWILDTIHE